MKFLWFILFIYLVVLIFLINASPNETKHTDDKSLHSLTTNESQREIKYKMNYDVFIKKQKRINRVKRTFFHLWEFNYQIESVEVKLNWENFLKGKHVATGLMLRKGQKVVENLVLYAPRDRYYTFRGLLDASGYLGEIRVIRLKEAITKFNATNLADFMIFKIDTARIISETESKQILNALSRLPENDIKMESVSVVLKLPPFHNTDLILKVMSVSPNTTIPRALIHIKPGMSLVRINNLRSHSVVKLQMKRYNSTKKSDISSVLLFTGSVLSLKYDSSPVTSSSRLSSIQKYESRPKVTCYVENKEPFQGFPCKGTDVCIPLHWKCDGEKDCEDGFDELKCFGVLNSPYISKKPVQTRCRRTEFQCFSQNDVSCIPISWLCDGIRDCADGLDEDKRNCKYPSSQVFSTDNYSGVRCKKNYFRCRRNGCIPQRLVCDGHNDCGDGSDEYDCSDEEEEDTDTEAICDIEYEFKCFRSDGGRKFVPRPWECDGQADCPTGEDEEDDVCLPLFESRKNSQEL